MNNPELTEKVKGVALAQGADLVGVVNVSDLPEHADSIAKILPEATVNAVWMPARWECSLGMAR